MVVVVCGLFHALHPNILCTTNSRNKRYPMDGSPPSLPVSSLCYPCFSIPVLYPVPIMNGRKRNNNKNTRVYVNCSKNEKKTYECRFAHSSGAKDYQLVFAHSYVCVCMCMCACMCREEKKRGMKARDGSLFFFVFLFLKEWK